MRWELASREFNQNWNNDGQDDRSDDAEDAHLLLLASQVLLPSFDQILVSLMNVAVSSVYVLLSNI
jgi:hypothetical protein